RADGRVARRVRHLGEDVSRGRATNAKEVIHDLSLAATEVDRIVVRHARSCSRSKPTGRSATKVAYARKIAIGAVRDAGCGGGRVPRPPSRITRSDRTASDALADVTGAGRHTCAHTQAEEKRRSRSDQRQEPHDRHGDEKGG